MDHAGAVVGPLLVMLFLWVYPGEYRTLFALTIVPGAIAVLLIFFVKEDALQPSRPFIRAWRSRRRMPLPH